MPADNIQRGQRDRPNILLILADQLRPDVLGCYGGPVVRTPAIDALAARGTVFDSAYTPSPVCVPSRASLLTGREPQSNECYENGTPMPDSPTFLNAVSDVGYRTHGVGKMHFTPDPQAMRGFATRDRGEEFGTPDEDDYMAFLVENGYGHVEAPHGLRDEMYYVPQLSQVPDHLHFSHWVADRSIRFLQEQTDQPFLLWSSFIAPHPPFAPPSPWHRLYEPSLMPDPHEPAGGTELLTVYDRLQARYKFRDGGRDRRLWQLIRAYYYASVSYVDSQIARILGALETAGKLENTLVVLTADHGEFLGDYGTFGKRSFLDRGARVPLILAGPGFGPGRRSEPVSLIDLFPTFAEVADATGSQLEGAALQRTTAGRPVYGQYQQGEMGLYAVITDGWKYIWSAPDGREFLLDRIRDPQETSNLAYNVRVREQLLEMRHLASSHFRDLTDVDFDAAASNGSFELGAPPDAQGVRSLMIIEHDREASTLVVRGGEWADAPTGYHRSARDGTVL